MKKKFEDELRLLQKKRINKAKKLLTLDELNSDVLALNHMLRDLKHRRSQGIITEKEYQKAVAETTKRSQQASQQIANAKREMKNGPVFKPKPAQVPEPFGEKKPVKKRIKPKATKAKKPVKTTKKKTKKE
jgi:hypothetical protein